MKSVQLFIISFFSLLFTLSAQDRKNADVNEPPSLDELFSQLSWRNIGPFRGGRSVAVTGVVSNTLTYYMGSTGGGVWKTTDGGIEWVNISDGFFKTGTVGALAVAESDPNVVYAGMGEHAIRGVMTSSGDGVYRSTDAGKTWVHIGLDNTLHISDVIVHPKDPDVVYVAAQGAQYGPSSERGIYKSENGGKSWRKVLFIDENTGASSLSMDMTNPRILYAAMWEHRRYPWAMESGGKQSGLYKSVDGGENWEKMETGLPETIGKAGISVSRAQPDRVWAVIEAEGDKAGVYRSDDSGKKWKQINKDRINITRSWYYMEIFADPVNENTVYVLNAPMMRSIDGGKTFSTVSTPHGDNHDLWINPLQPDIMINANDGGANVSFNGGKSWSTQQNQPTAQFYRVITDNRMPYYVYGGQQDNSAIAIASRTNDQGIDWKDWYSVAGCESAYLAFDPNDPKVIFGGCYQGIIERWEQVSRESKEIKEYPELSLGNTPKDFKYRYNWNAPIITSPHDRNTVYHAGNVVFKTEDQGLYWEVISPDLTRNDKSKQGPGGKPFTNEAAGGENYNTIMYLTESPHEKGVLWAGSDDGLVHLTQNSGKDWVDVTPAKMKEGIVNSIEVSPHDPATAYITLMRYKFHDLRPYIYKTNNYGKSWELITNGIEEPHTFVRVVREDPKVKGLLYAGSETGLYISFNNGKKWQKFQRNLPVVPVNDLIIQDNDLVVATAGRSFWILDDLSAIQQTAGKMPEAPLAIFTPKDTYRMFGGSVKEFTPGLGQNPANGVTIDYYLKENADSTKLTLKILDNQGKLLRTYNNQTPKNFKTWPGGPSKPDVLPGKAGVNRFTWNFRKEKLPAIDNVFVFGDYNGSRVGPGIYQVRLIMENDSVSTKINILPDPRINATTEHFKEQQQFLSAIENTVKEIHQSVNAMRSVKKQLTAYLSLLEDEKGADELMDIAKNLKKDIEAWEEQLIQPQQKTFQDVINFNNQLNAELLYLKSYADAAAPRLTKGAAERFSDLKKQWQVFADQKNELINQQMRQFNTLYKELGLPAVLIKKE
ncbi:VPS10 domain-containing protein [Ascidiimonas aurantiaca]|uniref:VPS10 domain-containing protein n=1 Tax=Ascidiimonas aurantiaca TaxID=1685432 RepID=UPI0030ECE5E3